MGDLVDLVGDQLAEFGDAFSGFAGGGDELFDLGIFFLECALLEIEGMFVSAVTNDDDGGVAAIGFDELEPVFDAVLLFVFAVV